MNLRRREEAGTSLRLGQGQGSCLPELLGVGSGGGGSVPGVEGRGGQEKPFLGPHLQGFLPAGAALQHPHSMLPSHHITATALGPHTLPCQAAGPGKQRCQQCCLPAAPLSGRGRHEGEAARGPRPSSPFSLGPRPTSTCSCPWRATAASSDSPTQPYSSGVKTVVGTWKAGSESGKPPGNPKLKIPTPGHKAEFADQAPRRAGWQAPRQQADLLLGCAHRLHLIHVHACTRSHMQAQA